MQLTNLKTGKPETLDEDALIPALADGTHVPDGAKALINPEGELVFSPTKNVQANLAQYGYTIPTQDQLSELANQKKYGEGIGNVAKATLEGVSRGTTFGLSDVIEPALFDTTPEAIKQRRERNPISSTVGEIGGAVGSALIAPELAPAGILGKAGVGIAERLAPAALGEGATIASKVLNSAGQIGAKFAGSSVEGAVWGLGQSVTEAALGDPDLNAEKIMANIGYGGLFGGALGGLIKTGEMAVPAAIGKARDTLVGARNVLIGAPGEEVGPVGKAIASAHSAVTGESAAEIENAIKNRAEILDPAQRANLVKDLKKSVQDVHDSVTSISSEAGGKIRPAETAELLRDSDVAKVFQVATEADKNFTAAVEAMKAEPDLYPKAYKRELELIHEGFQNRVTGADVDAAKTFESLNTAKKLIDEQIPYDKIRQRMPLSPEEKRVVSLFKPLADSLRSGLEDEAVWGVAGARQAAFNEASTELQSATKDIRKLFWNKQLGGFDSKKFNTYVNEIKTESGDLRTKAIQRFFDASDSMVKQAEKTAESASFPGFDPAATTGLIEKSKGLAGNAQKAIAAEPGRGYGFFTDALYGTALGGPAGAAMAVGKAILDPRAAASRLGNLERAAAKSSEVISNASKAIFKRSSALLKKAVGPIAGELSYEMQKKQYDRRAEQIEEQNTAPVKTIDMLEASTRDMYHVAPVISSSIQMAALRGTQFLASKLPKPATPKLPFDKPFVPSRFQMIKFDRYYNIVHKPLAAMSELKEGRVNPETIETLQTVYPALYTEMKTEVINSLASILAKKQEVPYQKRMAISAFIGAPLDSSMLPGVAQSNQMILSSKAMEKNAQENAVSTTSKGIGNINLSGRLKTNVQDSAQREGA